MTDAQSWYRQILEKAFPDTDFKFRIPKVALGTDRSRELDELVVRSSLGFVFGDLDTTKIGYKLGAGVWTKDLGCGEDLEDLQSISSEIQRLSEVEDALKRRGYADVKFVKDHSGAFYLGHRYSMQGDGSTEYIVRIFKDFRDVCMR